MQRKGILFTSALAAFLTTFLAMSPVSYAYSTLRPGMSGQEVSNLQKDLKQIGAISFNATGYYGDKTVWGVKNFQKKYGLSVDGIAGQATFTVIDRLLGRNTSNVSRGGNSASNYMIPWFGGAENILQRGDEATVFDIDSGLSFKIKRTYGYNHSDSEALTAKDAATIKKIYDGQWSWVRRAVIVTVDGKRIAASMAGMPHAGLDNKPANVYVEGRSSGYGAGLNLDTVKGNGMNGHFDIHFLNSRTHGTNHVDPAHQAMVKKAGEWAARNY